MLRVAEHMQDKMMMLARIMAALGGLVLGALVLMVCASIIGRSFGDLFHLDWMAENMPGLAEWGKGRFWAGPVKGDTEIVEMGLAFAISAFLPYCQLTGGHAIVDVFTSGLSKARIRILTWVGELLFAVVLIICAIQVGSGMFSKVRSGQTTFLLEMNVWWGYAGLFASLVVAAIVAVYVAVARTIEVVRGVDILPKQVGADH